MTPKHDLNQTSREHRGKLSGGRADSNEWIVQPQPVFPLAENQEAKPRNKTSQRLCREELRAAARSWCICESKPEPDHQLPASRNRGLAKQWPQKNHCLSAEIESRCAPLSGGKGIRCVLVAPSAGIAPGAGEEENSGPGTSAPARGTRKRRRAEIRRTRSALLARSLRAGAQKETMLRLPREHSAETRRWNRTQTGRGWRNRTTIRRGENRRQAKTQSGGNFHTQTVRSTTRPER
jgi:hypothetical protein